MERESITLGPSTIAGRREPLDMHQPRPLPAELWLIRTDVGGFGGNVPPGTDTSVRSYATVEAAQAMAGFHLATPAILPAGYALREVLVPPGGHATTVLIFGGTGRDIVLAETPVGRQAPEPSSSGTLICSTSVRAVTDGTLEQTDLDGRQAAWMNRRSLLWEAEGVSFHLGGLDLTLEQAKAIASSLR